MTAMFPSLVLRMFPRAQFHAWRQHLLSQAGIGLAVRFNSSSTPLTKVMSNDQNMNLAHAHSLIACEMFSI